MQGTKTKGATVIIHNDAVCKTDEEKEYILDRASKIIYDMIARKRRERSLENNERAKSRVAADQCETSAGNGDERRQM